MSEDPWMNIPLTATEALTMESRPKQPKYARNKNIVVIGGSGSGKTRFFVKPSVMQMNCSMVITDPKGTLIVIAMLQSQLFNLLCDKADDEYGGRLPVHVRVIADEFANIGQIPQFDKLIATIRSREISASIILQSQSQLKAMYKDSADTILGNCDTTLFLGGKEKTTLKEMSELLGKETIDLYNTSETRSNQKSFGLNYQKTGKQLMTEDEIAVMDGGKCILQIRGARPFFSDKYDITKHKNYRLLADENEKNRYKVEKELNPQYTPKSEEEVEVIHVELSE